MKAYQYDSETKKYIGEIERQIDPLESQAQGKDIYLMPADSTDVVPPEPKDGYDIVFNGTGWEYKEIEKEPEPEPYVPTVEELQARVRSIRNYLLNTTDKYVSVPDFPIDESTRNQYIEYRQYLRDYTESDNWWLSEPLAFDAWVKTTDGK